MSNKIQFKFIRDSYEPKYGYKPYKDSHIRYIVAVKVKAMCAGAIMRKKTASLKI